MPSLDNGHLSGVCLCVRACVHVYVCVCIHECKCWSTCVTDHVQLSEDNLECFLVFCLVLFEACLLLCFHCELQPDWPRGVGELCDSAGGQMLGYDPGVYVCSGDLVLGLWVCAASLFYLVSHFPTPPHNVLKNFLSNHFTGRIIIFGPAYGTFFFHILLDALS